MTDTWGGLQISTLKLSIYGFKNILLKTEQFFSREVFTLDVDIRTFWHRTPADVPYTLLSNVI